MNRLLLASANPGKLRELRGLAVGLGIEVEGLDAFPDLEPPEEYGRTFFENAFVKALYYRNRTGRVTLADDSGLEVQALGGAPGVRSARYAGAGSSDAANNARLIRTLQARGGPRPWRARFVCVLVAMKPLGYVSRRGTCEGEIIPEPAGSGGFGYDPHFFLPDRGRTMAQLTPEEKQALSHRGRAFRAVADDLPGLLERGA